MFKQIGSKVNFPQLERDILAWWQKTGIVEKYLHLNDNAKKKFSFIDGPITANNPMGVHHAWGRTYKDLFQRYKTMQGFKQRYQNGFDGQGLWIEVEVEKELGFKSKRDIEEYGIDRFVALCKERVSRFAGVQTEQSIRLGYWMDWDNSYHTMSDENNYTIWHFLKLCHQRGWLYEGTDVMPWCPRCGTGLSEHEIVTEGYKTLVHPGVFLRFPLEGRSRESLLVWTTTPWTLTSNVVAAVNPELTYVKAIQGDEILYLAKSLLSVLRGEYKVIEEFLGKALVGLTYSGPFDELPVQKDIKHKVIPWDGVSENEGTGVVHSAPGAGKEDFALGKEFGLDVIAPLDEGGVFVEGFDWLTGSNVSEVNDPIFESLRQKGLLYHIEQYSHRYPVCWRCDTELVFRLVDEWFISMDEVRHLIAKVTKKIRWIPEFGLERELDWLRNMDDWMISKKRYWGLALPIYKCKCGHFEVMGSENELQERAVKGWEQFAGNSPHRPWIDAVKIKCPKCGETVSRIRDVGNPWLDAGIVPFATLDYRHNRDYWREWFPADWISESFPGQFRNWFYSLLTMSTVLEDCEPFRNVFTYALVRDEKGEEMHKSKGNAIWFDDAAEKMGVDAMRWMYALHNPANNLNLGYNTADEVRRHFLIPLWNVYSFFITYANIDGFNPVESTQASVSSDLDKWIRSELNFLVAEVTEYLDDYDPASASRRVSEFVDLVSNWYVRRSRRRFWKSENDDDKLSAYSTLYIVLTTLSKLMAPFTPFLAEEMYRNLVCSVDKGAAESVHLTRFPESKASLIDQQLMESTRLAMRISSMGRSARARAGIKVRQPLERVEVKLRSNSERKALEQVEQQVVDELNVKRLEIMIEDSEIYLKAQEAIHQEQEGIVSVDGYWVSLAGGYAVVVDTTVTPELAQEGLARELVHRVQNLRKSAGFDLTDHIVVYYQGPDGIEEVMRNWASYIRQETLADELRNEEPDKSISTDSRKVAEMQITLGVQRL